MKVAARIPPETRRGLSEVRKQAKKERRKEMASEKRQVGVVVKVTTDQSIIKTSAGATFLARDTTFEVGDEVEFVAGPKIDESHAPQARDVERTGWSCTVKKRNGQLSFHNRRQRVEEAPAPTADAGTEKRPPKRLIGYIIDRRAANRVTILDRRTNKTYLVVDRSFEGLHIDARKLLGKDLLVGVELEFIPAPREVPSDIPNRRAGEYRPGGRKFFEVALDLRLTGRCCHVRHDRFGWHFVDERLYTAKERNSARYHKIRRLERHDPYRAVPR
ncbi:MAG: hypothetical protein C4521_05200 [Actinobacteria bacterium]|nr:MAG: hypothetical protein C4521_05200 [Actinomycetota bacterium]